MRKIVTSDIHLGNAHCRADRFLAFLDALVPDDELVLNGDVVDRQPRVWPDAHRRALERLREESRRRRVVWVRGNHEATYVLDDPGAIEFRDELAIGDRLYVTHGHDFNIRLPFGRAAFLLFRTMYQVRVWLTRKPEHIADFARSFAPLYRILCNSVAHKAAAAARARGFAAVTCGHTHFAEDVMIEGVRYINTGSWTNDLPRAVVVDETAISVVPDAGRMEAP